jgi:hypothetical protein
MLTRLLLLYLASFLAIASIVMAVGLRRIIAAALALPFVAVAALVLAAGVVAVFGMR